MADQVRPWFAKPAPAGAPRVRVNDRGVYQQIPSGTAAKSCPHSPNVREQSSPSRCHELIPWHRGRTCAAGRPLLTGVLQAQLPHRGVQGIEVEASGIEWFAVSSPHCQVLRMPGSTMACKKSLGLGGPHLQADKPKNFNRLYCRVALPPSAHPSRIHEAWRSDVGCNLFTHTPSPP